MRNILVMLLVMEFKLTKKDKFIGVTWLLHKAYLENVSRSIVCMHIKSGLSWESRVMRLGIEKNLINKWEIDQMKYVPSASTIKNLSMLK
jgi:hypothetical protein